MILAKVAMPLNLNVVVYDLAGNLGSLSQSFQIDKPEQINLEDMSDSDISELENTIYVEPVNARTGSEVTISVKMKNAVEAEGFQFDLELPEGVTVAKDADGFAEARLSTERTTSRKTNIFDCTFLENGALRVIAGSTNGSNISGNDGEVAIIKLLISNGVQAGSYPIVIRNIAISDTNAESHDVDMMKSTLWLSSAVIGDANGDGEVTITDAVSVVNYILGNPSAGFNFDAADVNGDGNISITDAVGVVNIILNQNGSSPSTTRLLDMIDDLQYMPEAE